MSASRCSVVSVVLDDDEYGVVQVVVAVGVAAVGVSSSGIDEGSAAVAVGVAGYGSTATGAAGGHARQRPALKTAISSAPPRTGISPYVTAEA